MNIKDIFEELLIYKNIQLIQTAVHLFIIKKIIWISRKL